MKAFSVFAVVAGIFGGAITGAPSSANAAVPTCDAELRGLCVNLSWDDGHLPVVPTVEPYYSESPYTLKFWTKNDAVTESGPFVNLPGVKTDIFMGMNCTDYTNPHCGHFGKFKKGAVILTSVQPGVYKATRVNFTMDRTWTVLVMIEGTNEVARIPVLVSYEKP